VAIPGQGDRPAPVADAPAPPPPATGAVVSSTTTMGVNGLSMQITTTQTVQGMPGPDQPPAPAAPAKPASVQKSKIVFLSDTGQCEVFLDGKSVADLGLSGMGEPAKATVFDLKPSTYKIKVTSFNDTWYDGKITIGNGEILKIQIDPETFEIISRDPL
jgi:hypothetical protein